MNVWLIIGLGLLGSVLFTLALARMLGGRSVTPSDPDWRTTGITFPAGWTERTTDKFDWLNDDLGPRNDFAAELALIGYEVDREVFR